MMSDFTERSLLQLLQNQSQALAGHAVVHGMAQASPEPLPRLHSVPSLLKALCEHAAEVPAEPPAAVLQPTVVAVVCVVTALLNPLNQCEQRISAAVQILASFVHVNAAPAVNLESAQSVEDLHLLSKDLA